MQAPPSDALLAQRATAGDKEAFAALFDLHAPVVLGVLTRMLRRRELAEEVLQEAFLQAWRRLETFNPQRGSVRAWLMTIARSRALDHIKSAKARGQREDRVGRYESVQVQDPIGTTQLEAAEDQSRVRAALAELPTEQRQAIELAYFGGLSHSQLAEHLEAPLGTVKSRVKLGMTKLRTLLAS